MSTDTNSSSFPSTITPPSSSSSLRANVPIFRPRFIRAVQLSPPSIRIPDVSSTYIGTNVAKEIIDEDMIKLRLDPVPALTPNDFLINPRTNISPLTDSSSTSIPTESNQQASFSSTSSSLPSVSPLSTNQKRYESLTSHSTTISSRSNKSSRVRELARILKSAKATTSVTNVVDESIPTSTTTNTIPSSEDKQHNASSTPYYIYPHTPTAPVPPTLPSATPSPRISSSSLDTLIHISNRWNILHQLAISSEGTNIQTLDTLYRTHPPWEWFNALNAKDKYGDRPIHIAARNGCTAILEIFLREVPKKYTVDINIRTVSSLGLTSLHLACLGGHIEVVNLLLRHGVDIQAKDKYKRNALYYTIVCAAVCHPVSTSSSATSIYLTKYNDAVAILDMLLNAGIDVNNVDSEGYVPIYYASITQINECLEPLILRGAGILSATVEYPSLPTKTSSSSTPTFSSTVLPTDVQSILRYVDQANRLQITKTNTTASFDSFASKRHDKGNKISALSTSSPSVSSSSPLSSTVIISPFHALAEAGNTLALHYILQAIRALNGQENVSSTSLIERESSFPLSSINDSPYTSPANALFTHSSLSSPRKGSSLTTYSPTLYPHDPLIPMLLLSRETTFPYDTPIHSAIRSCSPSAVAYLLRLSEQYNCLATVLSMPNKEGYTPLHICCSNDWEREENELLLEEEERVRIHMVNPDIEHTQSSDSNKVFRTFFQATAYQTSSMLMLRRQMWDLWEMNILSYEHSVFTLTNFQRSSSLLWRLCHENDLSNDERNKQQANILTILINAAQSIAVDANSIGNSSLFSITKGNKTDSSSRLSPLAVALQSSNTNMALQLLSSGAILDSTAIAMFSLPYFSIIRHLQTVPASVPVSSAAFDNILNNKPSRMYLERKTMCRYPWWNIDTPNTIMNNDNIGSISEQWIYYDNLEYVSDKIRQQWFYLLRPVTIGAPTLTDPEGILSIDTSYRLEAMMGFTNEQIALRSLGCYIQNNETNHVFNLNDFSIMQSQIEWKTGDFATTYKHHPSLWSFTYIDKIKGMDSMVSSADLFLCPQGRTDDNTYTSANVTTDGWMNISQELNNLVNISVTTISSTFVLSEQDAVRQPKQVQYTVSSSISSTNYDAVPTRTYNHYENILSSFPVHRSIVSIRSDYLRILINHYMEYQPKSTAESTIPILPVSVASRTSLQIILRWIYTDQCSESILLEYEGQYIQELWAQFVQNYDPSTMISETESTSESYAIEYVQLPLPPYILLLIDVSVLVHIWNLTNLQYIINELWLTIITRLIKCHYTTPNIVIDYLYHVYLAIIGLQTITNHNIGTAAVEYVIQQAEDVFTECQKKHQQEYISEHCYFRIARTESSSSGSIVSLSESVGNVERFTEFPNKLEIETSLLPYILLNDTNVVANTPTSIIPVLYRCLYDNTQSNQIINNHKRDIGPLHIFPYFSRAIHGLYGYISPIPSITGNLSLNLTSSYLYSTIRLYLASVLVDLGFQELPSETILHCWITVLQKSILYLLDHTDIRIPLCGKIWTLSLLEKSNVLNSNNFDLLPYDVHLLIDIPALFTIRIPDFIIYSKNCQFCSERKKHQLSWSHINNREIPDEGCMPEPIVMNHCRSLLLWYTLFPSSIAREINPTLLPPSMTTNIVSNSLEVPHYPATIKRFIESSKAVGAYSDMEWLHALYQQQYTDYVVKLNIMNSNNNNSSMMFSLPVHAEIISSRIPTFYRSSTASIPCIRIMDTCACIECTKVHNNSQSKYMVDTIWKHTFARLIRWAYGDLWVNVDTLPLPTDNLSESLRSDEINNKYMDYSLFFSNHIKIEKQYIVSSSSLASSLVSPSSLIVSICLSCLLEIFPYSVVSQLLFLTILFEFQIPSIRLIGSLESWLMRWIRNTIDYCSFIYDKNDIGNNNNNSSSSIHSQRYRKSMELLLRTISSLTILLSIWRTFIVHYPYQIHLWRIESYISLSILRTISIFTKNMDIHNELEPLSFSNHNTRYWLPKVCVPYVFVTKDNRVTSPEVINNDGNKNEVSNNTNHNINCPCVTHYMVSEFMTLIPSIVIWVLQSPK